MWTLKEVDRPQPVALVTWSSLRWFKLFLSRNIYSYYLKLLSRVLKVIDILLDSLFYLSACCFMNSFFLTLLPNALLDS